MSDQPENAGHLDTPSNVRDIVNSIKTGEKNKPDAFLELRAVLKQSRARAGEQQGQPTPTTTGDGDSVLDSITGDGNRSRSSVGDRTQFTRESRHAIISQIIEKKKQQRLSSKQAETLPNDQSSYTHPGDDEGGNDRGYNDNDMPPEEDHDSRLNTAFPTSGGYNGGGGGRGQQQFNDHKQQQEYYPQNTPGGGGGYDAPRERPQSAGRLQRSRSGNRMGSSGGGGGMRRSSDDNVIDSRNMRVMQYESRLRSEIFKECTFQPQIKQLPSSYGAMKEKDTPFLTRVQHWQRDKDMSASRRKSISDRGELTDCTFQPKINRNSSRAARDMRPVDLQETTTERLYRSGGEIAEQKARFLEEERRREDDLEIQDCTFQPELKTNNRRFMHVTPKFDRHPERQVSREPYINKDCTFTPKVRGVRKSMDSAALYVTTDVVQRLTRPFGSDNQSGHAEELNKNFDMDAGRPVMDMASFMGTLGSGSTPRANFAGTTPKSRPSSAPHQRGGTAAVRVQLTQEEKEEKKRNYDAFLHRQTQTELRKAKHVGDAQLAMTPKFTPELCRRSISISASTNRGDFMERVERDNQRRVHENIKKQTDLAAQKDTFNPELSKKATRMRSRSSYEMSRGDLLKKETNQRLLKLRMEQEELKLLTFKPEVSKMAQNSKSTLKLKEDPQGYIKRYTRAEKEKDTFRASMLQQKEQNESLGCTFAPVTRECPAYVKRIARSLSIVKAARTVAAPPSRPEWK